MDCDNGELELLVDSKEIERRMKEWKQAEPKHRSGLLAQYAKLVTSAPEGAILMP